MPAITNQGDRELRAFDPGADPRRGKADVVLRPGVRTEVSVRLARLLERDYPDLFPPAPREPVPAPSPDPAAIRAAGAPVQDPAHRELAVGTQAPPKAASPKQPKPKGATTRRRRGQTPKEKS